MLTDKQIEVLNFIIKYKSENNGNSPSVTEIAAAVGVASTSTVDFHLTKLERAGKITRDGVKNIQVIGGEWKMEGVT